MSVGAFGINFLLLSDVLRAVSSGLVGYTDFYVNEMTQRLRAGPQSDPKTWYTPSTTERGKITRKMTTSLGLSFDPSGKFSFCSSHLESNIDKGCLLQTQDSSFYV